MIDASLVNLVKSCMICKCPIMLLTGFAKFVEAMHYRVNYIVILKFAVVCIVL